MNNISFNSFNDNVSVGTDIENISRFEKHALDRSSAFVLKIYTDSEINYCFLNKKPAQHLAARFCAKEAVYKALCGFGMKGINFKDIEIYHDTNNVPQVRLLDKKYKDFNCKISLSHCKNMAIANVLIQRCDNIND